MLQAGDPIPDARVWVAPRERVPLRNLTARQPLLILTFLFAWTSTWTDEFTGLRDRRKELEAAGVEAVGLSRDSPWTLIAWSQALDLDVPLLSDWNGEALRGFGVAREYRGFTDVAERAAFLIDRGGVVRGAWRYEDGDVPDFDALIEAARSL